MQISTRARSRTLPATLVTLAVLGVLPFVPLSARMHFVLTISVIYAIAAVGLEPFSGYGGQLTFGNFGFVALGSYASALLATDLGWPPLATLPVSVAVGGLVGWVLGNATVRLPHLGTAMGTFFFAFVVSSTLRGATLSPWTHGPNGVAVEKLTFGGAPISPEALYWLAWAALVVVALSSYRYVNSRAGRVLRLIKRSPVVADAMGVNVERHKKAAFVWSAMTAGLAGFIYAQAIEFLIPETFQGFESVILLTMAIMGGLGSIAGPIVGAVLFTVAGELTRSAADIRHVIFAVLLLASLIYLPDGLYTLVDRLTAYVRRTARPSSPARERGTREASEAGSLPSTVNPASHADVGPPDRGARTFPLLEVRDVQVNFGGVVAIASAGLTVMRGSVHAIIGPNGAGKTTLLNCISGLQRYQGTIVFNGAPLAGRAARDVRRAGISRTFQNPSLVPDLTVIENVQLGLYGTSPSAPVLDVLPLRSTVRRDARSEEDVASTLNLVGVPRDRWQVLAGDLSLAEQKIVDIARAIAGSPQLLLLDEPTAGLAEPEIEVIADVLRGLQARRDVTVLVIAHHIGFVRSVAARATVLDFGRVIADGSPDDVTRRTEVMQVFLGADE